MLLGSSLTALAQQVPYGNNPAAGHVQLVRGIQFYYEVYGEGKPLLMIHGNGGSISKFSNNIPYFAERYQVIAVDSRAHGKSTDPGDSLSFEMMADDFAALLTAMHIDSAYVDSRAHGKSTDPGDSLSFEMMADDFAALLTAMHIDSAYVVGWSDGGISAILLALRHPEKVKKVVSTGANFSPDSTAISPSLWKKAQNFYVSNKDRVRTTPEEKNKWKVFTLDVLQPNVPLSTLRSIKIPALIIAGDHDIIVTEHTVAIARTIPNAWLWIVPHSGHATLREHADEFNRKLDEFFRYP